MRITRATMRLLGPSGLVQRNGADVVTLTASFDIAEGEPGRVDIEMRWRDDLADGEATIYREIHDADRATAIGNEGPWVRTDCFVVEGARLLWRGSYLVVRGYMRGAVGVLRDGVSPITGRPHGSALDIDEDAALVSVEWTLT